MQAPPPRSLAILHLAFSALLLNLVLMPHLALAAPIASDSFKTTTNGSGGTYSSTFGTLSNGAIAGQNPTAAVSGFLAGASGAWLSGTNDIQVETSGLTHPLLQGTAQAGDVFANTSTNQRTVTRRFDGSVDTAITNQSNNNGEIWFSGLVFCANAPASTVPIEFGLSATVPGVSTAASGVLFGIDDGMIRLYVNGSPAGMAGTGLVTEFSITTGVTYLIAVKIDLNAGSTDAVTLQIYSPSAAFDSPTATIYAGGLNLATSSLRNLAVSRLGSGAYYTSTPRFDEFRLGLTQADVMAIPEPSTFGLLGMAVGGILLARRRR